MVQYASLLQPSEPCRVALSQNIRLQARSSTIKIARLDLVLGKQDLSPCLTAQEVRLFRLPECERGFRLAAKHDHICEVFLQTLPYGSRLFPEKTARGKDV